MADMPKIAIVDDDEGVRTSLASLVRSLGYHALTYASGQEFLFDSKEEPACMIVDVQMPTMSGDELQRTLVSSGRHVPMIFMTAFPVEAVRQRVMAAGARCFLPKPTDGETIIQHLEDALKDAAEPH